MSVIVLIKARDELESNIAQIGNTIFDFLCKNRMDETEKRSA